LLSRWFCCSWIKLRRKDVFSEDKADTVEDLIDGIYIVRDMSKVVLGQMDGKVRNDF